MKQTIIFALAINLCLCLHPGSAHAHTWGDTFYVNGNHIYDPCGNRFIPRGINYSLLDDWAFPANMNTGAERSSQVVLANPNMVRIEWYNIYSTSGRPAYSLTDLDSVISRFERRGIVSVIGLWDVTCDTDYTNFTNSIVNWWTMPAVVSLVSKHRKSIMVNIANEFGQVNWAPDPPAAFAEWKTGYNTAINAIRNAGINVPLVIDAPDCGTNLDSLLAAGIILESDDPLHNIVCSAHAYWAIATGSDSIALRARLSQINAAPFPVILGEIADYQADTTPCELTIGYQALLNVAQEFNLPWAAWTWTNDQCAARQLSNTGLFADLSPYGNTIINTSTFGLAATAVKSTFMINSQTCDNTAVPGLTNAAIAPITLLTGDHAHQVLQVNVNGTVRISDMYGRTVVEKTVTENTTIHLSPYLPPGMYIITHYSFLTGQYAIKTFL